MKREKEIGFIPIVVLVLACSVVLEYVPSDLFKRMGYKTVEHQDMSAPVNEMGFLVEKIRLHDVATKVHEENNGNRATEAIGYLSGMAKNVADKNPALLSDDPAKVAAAFNQASFSETKEGKERDAKIQSELEKMLAALPDQAAQLPDNEMDGVGR